MDYRIMGNVIKKRRNALRITQEQLAEMINKSTVYISLIESGARRPSLETLLAISRSLKLSVDSILHDNSSQGDAGYVDEFAFITAELNEDEINMIMDVLREILRHISRGAVVGADRFTGRAKNRKKNGQGKASHNANNDGTGGDEFGIYHDDGFGNNSPGKTDGTDTGTDRHITE